MNKEEFIKRRGKVAYEKMRQQARDWSPQHREEGRVSVRKWQVRNPDKVKANSQEDSCKGGKRYLKYLKYNATGLRGKRNNIRGKHGRWYRPYKHIIAPDSQIHHEWIPETAKYRGVALVETDRHMYGFIDVIKILEGKITLLTEKEIRGKGK